MTDRSDEISSGRDGLTGSYRQLWESQREEAGKLLDEEYQAPRVKLLSPVAQ